MPRSTHAFIVRVWYEEDSREECARVQRGYIEHVGSRQHLYFEDMTEILHFIHGQADRWSADRGAELALLSEEQAPPRG